jgi:DNA modification methylase
MTPRFAERDITTLRPSEYNPRTLTKARFEDLKKSLRNDPEFLKVRPIIINTSQGREGVIIGGHMRYEAAKALGWTTLPVIEVDVPLEQEKAWNVKDNAHHGESDEQMLAELIMQAPEQYENALPGDQLDHILNSYGPDGEVTEEDQVDAIANNPNPITQLGDVWQFGEHILVCGDSTDQATYDKLLNGTPADFCWTDPPYNVNIKGRGKDMQDTIANDDMSSADWSTFVTAWMQRLHQNVKGAVYVCMSAKEWPTVQSAFVANGFHWSDTIIWVKHQFTVGGSDYQKQYEPILVGKRMRQAEAEPILYGWPNGIDKKWNGGRDQSNAWFFKRPSKNPIHPTMKPVELVAKAIANSSQKDDLVLDPFAGGGSTVIACERLKRKARCIELSPNYCDAIIGRWIGHTKQQEIIKNGEKCLWGGAIITLEGVHDSL